MTSLHVTLPPLAVKAAAVAHSSGRSKRRRVGIRLILVTLAAVFGAMSITGAFNTQRFDFAGLAAVLAFLGALFTRLLDLVHKDADDTEAKAKAIEELVTSHAWRYAVGALPYPMLSWEAADQSDSPFGQNLAKYQSVLPDLLANAGAQQITPEMKTLRGADLDVRRAAYLQHRINPLIASSTASDRAYESRDRVLSYLVPFIEVIGILAGFAKAIVLTQVDLLGITAASAASLALWAETLNYKGRRRSAANIGRALTSATDDLNRTQNAYELALLVAQIEDRLALEAEAIVPSNAAPHTVGHGLDAVHTMSAEEYFGAVEYLKKQIWDGRLPKFEPDVIVGCNPGGAIVGGILYFHTRAQFLPVNWRSGLSRDAMKSMLDNVQWNAKKGDRLSILIVDASIKSGDSLSRTIRLVRDVVESKGWIPEESADDTPKYAIRTAVIANKPTKDPGIDVDYFYPKPTERFPYGNI